MQNKVMLFGKIESVTAKNVGDISVTDLVLATENRGEKTFTRVTAFNKHAEFAAALPVGELVFVEGRISIATGTSKGVAKATYKVIASNIEKSLVITK